VVIVPIYYKGEANAALNAKAHEIIEKLVAAGVRAHFDDRTNYNPGWKYNHWWVSLSSFLILLLLTYGL